MKIGFIGLGVMGFPMAGHLAEAGHSVRVYNRTRSKAESWCKTFSGGLAETPALAAEAADIVMTCVGNDDDLREVICGDAGALGTMQEGAILIDHTTASAQLARELDALCRKRQLAFVDAPVSGGQQGAQNGQLTVMCGGTDAAFQTARPIMDCFAKQVTLMGDVGSGQLTKMVNQICIAGIVQGLAEGLLFAENAGLDRHKVIQAIQKGAAQSWQMDNRHDSMINNFYEHGFAVDWMRKDLSLVLDEARRNSSGLPLTAMVDQFYADVQNMGGSRWDTSSLLARLKKLQR